MSRHETREAVAPGEAGGEADGEGADGRQKRGGRVVVVAGALVLAASALLVWFPPGGGGEPVTPPPAPVLVSPVELVEVADEVEALGTVLADERVELAAKVVERVTSVNFQDGQRVKAGDLLIELDAREVAAELAEARSALAEAGRQLERVKSVQGTGAVSGADIDVERARFEAARARVDLQEARLAERRITAPFDGVLGLRNVSPGAMVSPGEPLVTVVDTDPAKVDFTVPERHVSRLAAGLGMEASTAAYPGEVFRGEVRIVDATLNPASRAATVRAAVPNPDGRLLPGMLLKVRLVFGRSEALLVPESAIAPVGDKTFALVVDDNGGTTNVEVQTGRRIDRRVEIIKGLKAGQRVVTHGYRARPGAPVRVVGEGDVFKAGGGQPGGDGG